MTKICVNAASGRMSQQVISQISTHQNAELSAALCRSDHRLLGRQVIHHDIQYSDNSELALNHSDVVIDFSLPQATLTLIELATKIKKPLLIGTTGFKNTDIDLLKLAAKKIPVLLAPNTSIGVNSTLALLKLAAKMLGKKSDIEIIEAHHKHKVDSPSGTAIKMGEVIASAMNKKISDIQVTDKRFNHQTRQKGEIGMSSIRAGEIIGEHKVLFALDNEIITIEHKAQNRFCFAEGAVEAAIWLAKQSAGFYSMQDFLNG